MAKGLFNTCAVALVVSQTLWALPGIRPASAQQVTLPDNFISPNVPHDVAAGSGASIQDLAIFAWQEFIALNWAASDPAVSGLRGRPNTDVGFLDVAPDNGSFPLVVWQTYRHKNELFPVDGTTDPVFDSHMPTYAYRTNPSMGTGVNGQIPSFSLFNNLDEASQIGLANMYAHSTSVPPEAQPASGIRVAYEAKVNRAVFQYLVGNGLTNETKLTTAQQNTGPIYSDRNIPNVGICSPPPGISPSSIIMLPCGDLDVPGDLGEGAIEIKAAWRVLTPAEMSSGRFFTR